MMQPDLRLDQMQTSPVKPHSIAAVAIGQRIVAGEWAAGTTLPTEADLSRQYAVSRASMREAIKLLCGKGLLTALPRVGTIVRPKQDWNRLDVDVLAWQVHGGLTATAIVDLFELRMMIEPEAAAMAAARATEPELAALLAARDQIGSPDKAASIEGDIAFHRILLEATHNQFLASFFPAIEACLAASFRVSRAAVLTQEHVLPMHSAIAEAVAARDAGGARLAYVALLQRSRQDALTGAAMAAG